MKAVSVTKEVQEEMRVAGLASRQVAVWTKARMLAKIDSRGTKEMLFFCVRTKYRHTGITLTDNTNFSLKIS